MYRHRIDKEQGIGFRKAHGIRVEPILVLCTGTSAIVLMGIIEPSYVSPAVFIRTMPSMSSLSAIVAQLDSDMR